MRNLYLTYFDDIKKCLYMDFFNRPDMKKYYAHIVNSWNLIIKLIKSGNFLSYSIW